jgi:hypothetical protein
MWEEFVRNQEIISDNAMAGATCAEVRFAGARLCCPVCFDVADAVGNCRFTMAAEERTPSAMPTVFCIEASRRPCSLRTMRANHACVLWHEVGPCTPLSMSRRRCTRWRGPMYMNRRRKDRPNDS